MTTLVKQSERPSMLSARLAPHRGLLVAFAVLAVVFAALNLRLAQPFGFGDLDSTASSTASLALAAIGETIVVIGGGLDLSAGAVLSLSNCLFVTHVGSSTSSFVLGACAAVGAAALVGAVNGFLIAFVRLQPIVVTLATMFMTQGVTLLVMKQPGGAVPQAFSTAIAGDAFGGIVPMPLVVIAIGLVAWLVLKRTRFGTAVYAIGSDESAAHLKAFSTRAVKFWLYVISGCFYGMAGIFFSAQTGGGDPLAGAGMLLPIFVAVVLGGTPLGGGRGGSLGTVIGAFSVTLIANMLLVLNVSTYYSTIVEGFILILAVLGSSELTGVFQTLNLRGRQHRVARVSARPTGLESKPPSSDRVPRLTVGQRLTYSSDTIRTCLPSFVGMVVLISLTIFLNPEMGVGNYIQSMAVLASFFAVLALGQGAVVISGGLDLSVPFTITLAGVVLTGVTNGSNVAGLWAVPGVLALGALIGFLNGVGVSVFRISPLIMTLAMNGILQGAALVYTDGAPTGFAPPAIRWLMTGRLFGITPVIFCVAAFAATAWFLMQATVFGRRLFAVGSNPVSARYSGVSVNKVLIATYALSGVCSALVGVMLSGFTGQAFNDMGDPYLLTSIAVVVVGGTLMTGGRGNYAGMLGGALMLTALGTLLSSSILPSAARSIVYGVVVLAAVVAMREKPSS